MVYGSNNTSNNVLSIGFTMIILFLLFNHSNLLDLYILDFYMDKSQKLIFLKVIQIQMNISLKKYILILFLFIYK